MSDLMVNNLNLALDDGSTSYADLLAGLVEFNQLTPLLALVPVEALAAALRQHKVADCIMRPVDVLAQACLTQEETGEDDAAYTSRLARSADWLASNREQIEEAMTQAGFNTIDTLYPYDIGREQDEN